MVVDCVKYFSDDNASVYCVWFVDNKKEQSDFPPDALERFGRRCDEDDSARGDHRAAIIRRADIDGQHGRNVPRIVTTCRAKRAIQNGSPRPQSMARMPP